MRLPTVFVVLALSAALALSCATNGAAAREGGGTGTDGPPPGGGGPSDGGPPAAPAATGETASAPTTERTARVAVAEDAYGEAIEVTDPHFVKPTGGLLAGSGDERVKEIRLYKGAHQVFLEVDRVSRIDVEGTVSAGTFTPDLADKGLLRVKVTLDDKQVVTGKVDRDLELRGSLPYGKYRGALSRLRFIVLRA